MLDQVVALRPKSSFANSGFTLIEMAVVLLILGTLLGGLLTAVTQVSENARRTDARSQLERIEEALYGFAQAYGYLPCPATSTSDGYEAPIGGGDCTAQHGFVPAATLGLYGSINADALLLDPWSNPYRYSVAVRDSSGNDRAFTDQGGLNTEFSDGNLTTTDMLRVCEDETSGATCTATVLSDLVPAIVLSMGADWATFTSASETENAGGATDGVYSISNTEDFISTEFSEDLFDDILIWISPYVLYGRLITAGQLP